MKDRLWYNADGSATELATAEEVIEKRQEAARELARLRREVEILEACVRHYTGISVADKALREIAKLRSPAIEAEITEGSCTAKTTGGD